MESSSLVPRTCTWWSGGWSAGLEEEELGFRAPCGREDAWCRRTKLYVITKFKRYASFSVWLTWGTCVVHAWSYRRYVLASMPVQRPETAELDYTLRKIEANFSNFSAWHQRSKVYASLWEQGILDEAKCKDEGAYSVNLPLYIWLSHAIPAEFELVKQALYVDPYDQSSWIYHRWLIGDGQYIYSSIEIYRCLTESSRH